MKVMSFSTASRRPSKFSQLGRRKPKKNRCTKNARFARSLMFKNLRLLLKHRKHELYFSLLVDRIDQGEILVGEGWEGIKTNGSKSFYSLRTISIFRLGRAMIMNIYTTIGS
jgi:hypothetical protein